MKIILEGCDGSGKSTLAKTLAKVFNANIEHDSEPQTIENYIERLSSPGNTVYDRFMLGQFVYNTPKERKMTRQQLNHLIKYCKSREDIILIYIDQDNDIIEQRLEQRADKEKYMIDKLGVNSIGEFVAFVKERYSQYIQDFVILKGEDINVR